MPGMSEGKLGGSSSLDRGMNVNSGRSFSNLEHTGQRAQLQKAGHSSRRLAEGAEECGENGNLLDWMCCVFGKVLYYVFFLHQFSSGKLQVKYRPYWKEDKGIEDKENECIRKQTGPTNI